MKIFKNIPSFIKGNLKLILFSFLYIIFFVFAFSLIIAATESINHIIKGKYVNSFSKLFLFIALISLLCIIIKKIAFLLFKEKSSKIINNLSIIVIIIGFILTTIVFFACVLFIDFPLYTENELTTVFSILLLIPFYIALIALIVISCISLTFIAFSLLIFSIQKIRIIKLTILISSILWGFSLLNIFNVDFSEQIFQDIIDMTGDGYYNENPYFIHNDLIYAYVFGEQDYNNGQDEFFSVDFDGTNKKIISNSDQMRYAQFIHIENNFAYYYTIYTNSINKINLENGEISLVHQFAENEGGWWYVHYEYAVEKFYDLLPQYKNSLNNNYAITCEDTSFRPEPQSITLLNTENNQSTQYDNVIYYRLNENILYLIHGEKIKNSLYYSADNLKNIYVEKIILE